VRKRLFWLNDKQWAQGRICKRTRPVRRAMMIDASSAVSFTSFSAARATRLPARLWPLHDDLQSFQSLG